MTRVLQISDRELTRLRVMIDLADDRLTVGAGGRFFGCVVALPYPATAMPPVVSDSGPGGSTYRNGAFSVCAAMP